MKEFDRLIEEQWNSGFRLRDYGVMFNEKKRKLYIVSKDVEMIVGFEGELRIDSVGLYFGELMKEGLLRLSIEGSQLVGRDAKKNVVDFDEEQIRKWINGQDVEVEGVSSREFVLIRHRGDFYGCGKVVEREGKVVVLNFVPKARRIKNI